MNIYRLIQSKDRIVEDDIIKNCRKSLIADLSYILCVKFLQPDSMLKLKRSTGLVAMVSGPVSR